MTKRRFILPKRRSVMTKGRFVTLPCSKQIKKGPKTTGPYENK